MRPLFIDTTTRRKSYGSAIHSPVHVYFLMAFVLIGLTLLVMP